MNPAKLRLHHHRRAAMYRKDLLSAFGAHPAHQHFRALNLFEMHRLAAMLRNVLFVAAF
jgi:hypothetical protein